MALENILTTGKTEGAETVTFYHISTEVDAFKSFFREGAKPIGEGQGGQANGFYVWSNKKAAERHVSFLHDGAWANKNLKNDEALIVGVSIPKASISYPLWQQDSELPIGLFELCASYGDFLNQKAQNLDITLPPENTPFEFDLPFNKITAISYDKTLGIIFRGLDDKGKKRWKTCPDGTPCLARGSIKFQILTDWLCQNNPDFKRDYDALIQKTMTEEEGCALKYTGSEPLPISFVEHVKINEDGSLKTTTIFDAKKGPNQACPFFTLGNARTGKTK